MQDIHDIQKHFQKFIADLGDLASRLGSAQYDITNKGLIPDRSLVELIEKFLVNFQVFRAELRSQAADLGLELTEAQTNPVNTGDLEKILQLCLDEITHRETAIAEGAAKVEEVLGFRHMEDPDFSALETIKQDAGSLLEKLKNTTDLEKGGKLLQEAEPILAFQELCRRWDKMDDQLCEELRVKVALRFSNTLAMAAIRGKIQPGPAPITEPILKVGSAGPSGTPVPAEGEKTKPTSPPSSNPFPWQR